MTMREIYPLPSLPLPSFSSPRLPLPCIPLFPSILLSFPSLLNPCPPSPSLPLEVRPLKFRSEVEEVLYVSSYSRVWGAA